MEKNLEDILEIVVAIKDNMATHEGLAALDTKLTNKIDALDNKMIMELRSIQTDLDNIKVRLAEWEKRTREDADAHGQDILDLKHRVDEMEKIVKRLQGLQPA
jgi:hypothetical protein